MSLCPYYSTIIGTAAVTIVQCNTLVVLCSRQLIPVADRCHAVGMAGCDHSKIASVRAYVLFVLYVVGTR